MGAAILLSSLTGNPAARRVREVTEPSPHALRALLSALPSMAVIVIVLAGILGGVFSATEASAIAVAYSLFLGIVVHRKLRFVDLFDVLLVAAKKTSVGDAPDRC